MKNQSIKSITGYSKLIIEVPHQRDASIYLTNLKLTDYISESSNFRFRESLNDLSHYHIITHLNDIKDVLEWGCNGHQGDRKRRLLSNWCYDNLSDAQCVFVGLEVAEKELS